MRRMRWLLWQTLISGPMVMMMTHALAAPLTYVLDYGPNHVDRPEYLAEVASSPPMLLHLGKDVPFTHNWGPIQALGGENQAWGKGEYVRRLSPAEVRARIQALTRMVEGLHQAGVQVVMPYICSMTLAGHHERRTGFWEFYDHWEEYAEFGLGPKPPADPITWMQRRPDGGLHRFYTYEGDFYPPYEPNHRYAACVNNPHWRSWLLKVTENIARCGYDGVFVDNGGSQRCYCDFCQEGYRQFLAQRYTPPEVRALFGERPALAETPGTLAWVETQRFWKESLRRHHVAIREAGERVRGQGRFRVFVNGGERRPENVRLSHGDADFIMFERSYGEQGTHPGLVVAPIVENLTVREVNDNVFEYKYTRAQGRRVQPMVLTRGGYPTSLPHLAMTPDSALLGMAECAAFAGSGGFLLRPDWKAFGAALNTCNRFFTQKRTLFEAAQPWAPVAVAALGEQNLYGNTRHIEMVRRITRSLLDGHVLFDYLPEERLNRDGLKPYAVVIFPGVEYADSAAITALREYVRSGGAVVAIEPLPEKDRRLQPLPEPLPEGGTPDANLEAAVRTEGRGLWVCAERLRSGAQLLAWLTRATGTDFSLLPKDASSLVRFNAFLAPGRLLLHVVNYHVPLGTPPAPAVPAEGLRVSLPLPAGVRPVGALVHDLEKESPIRLECREENGRYQFTLPTLRIYQVVEIRLRGD